MKHAATKAPVEPAFLKSASLHVGLIVVLTTIVYAGSFHVAWLFDDRHAIVENPAIRDLGAAFRQIGSGTRSLVQFTFALNYQLGGLDPWGYHLFNLAVHAGAALCLYGWLRVVL